MKSSNINIIYQVEISLQQRTGPLFRQCDCSLIMEKVGYSPDIQRSPQID